MAVLEFAVLVFAAAVCDASFHSSEITRITSNHVTQYETQDWPPKFCNGLDCPKYTVVNSTKEYEIRDYEASRWVSTEQLNIAYNAAIYEMFMRLFHYISGNNTAGEKIDMTAPVINRIIPGQGPACENNFTMSFYISEKVTDPPTPTDKKVFLSKMPKMRVYVRSFGGWANENDYIRNGRALAEALPASAKYVKDYFYTAGYDAPFKLFDRHNEVWFIGM